MQKPEKGGIEKVTPELPKRWSIGKITFGPGDIKRTRGWGGGVNDRGFWVRTQTLNGQIRKKEKKKMEKKLLVGNKGKYTVEREISRYGEARGTDND